MRARDCRFAAVSCFLAYWHDRRGQIPPPSIISIIQFLFTIQVKKDIARHDILDSMHENASMHEIWVMASPLYISEFVHNHVSPFGERGNRSVLRLENKLYLFRALYCVSRANVV